MSYGINHQVGIKASSEEIYKYLTETEKLAQWLDNGHERQRDKGRGTLLNFDFMVPLAAKFEAGRGWIYPTPAPNRAWLLTLIQVLSLS
jgi:hypothetical protein